MFTGCGSNNEVDVVDAVGDRSDAGNGRDAQKPDVLRL